MSAPPAAVFVSPPPAPESRILALPPAELPNPWASERPSIPSEPASVSTTSIAPTPDGGSLRGTLLRGGLMLLVSAVLGVGIQTGMARARRMRAAPPAAVPVVTQVAVAAPAPVATPSVSPTEGDLEIHAPPAASVAVDGKVRGTGPTVSLRLAPGYHTVRVGLDKTAIVEVHRGTLAAVDLSK